MKIYDTVLGARRKDRLMSGEFIGGIISSFIELHGDRRFGDDAAIISGIGSLKGMPVTVIGIEKGHETEEKIAHNFGSVYPEGYRKALRQMKLAEKFNRPVICFVDTAGAFCGIDAEERGEGQAIAENLFEMMTLRVPVISVIIGEGGSGGALALAVADRVWMMENAYYSVISPEACASILWKDPSKAPRAAAALKLTAGDLLKLGVIEKIIDEPDGLDKPDVRSAFFNRLADDVYNEICRLREMNTDDLLNERYEKYRKVGRYDGYTD